MTKGSVCICSIPHARLIVGLQRLVQGRSSDVCCVGGGDVKRRVWWPAALAVSLGIRLTQCGLRRSRRTSAIARLQRRLNAGLCFLSPLQTDLLLSSSPLWSCHVFVYVPAQLGRFARLLSHKDDWFHCFPVRLWFHSISHVTQTLEFACKHQLPRSTLSPV